MSDRYVVIVDGVVTNSILWDGNEDVSTGGFHIPDGWTLVRAGEVPIHHGSVAVKNQDGTWSFTPAHTTGKEIDN